MASDSNSQQPLSSGENASRLLHVKQPSVNISQIRAIPTFGLGDTLDITPIHAYLKHYGYLPCSSSAPNANESVSEETTSALRSFQEFHNLQVDGVFGNETRTAMTASRCGLPDISPLGSNSVAFSVVGPWKDRNIRYTFGPMSMQLDTDVCMAAFERAINTWESAGVGLTFTKVENDENPEVWIEFRAANDPDYSMVGSVLAHADFPPGYSVVVNNLPLPVHFDDQEHRWVDGAVADSFDIETVALHELGHILGLAHSGVNGAVMFSSVSPNFRLRTLAEDDLNAIRNAYPNWRSLGGPYFGIPAVVSWVAGRTDVFVRGRDNAVYHKYQNGGGTAFLPSGPYENLGGIIFSDVTAVSWGPNRIDLFGLGTDNACWHKWWDGAAWRGWESLGGLIIGDIEAVSWGANRLDLFVRGMDNGVYHKAWNGNAWTPSIRGWTNLGGKILGSPKAVCWGPNRIDCFVRGLNNAVHQKTWNGSSWLPSLTSWKNLGGTVMDDVTAVSRRSNHLDLIVRGTGNSVHQKTWNGSAWLPSEQNWQDLGGIIMSRPAAVAWGGDRLSLAAQGTDNGVWTKEWDGSAWTGWTSIGGVVTDAPVVDPRGGERMAIYVRGVNASLYAFD
ncbi:carbohydrate-binding protein [Dactylonectria macrodidyma]|uniref:Carbohydrate-binding protein n=1 Tax=Dactylonectria macrodidyma TaxID=307937 RepID=A0A9P9D887_9HYPO|nr:carbohydrate-binding protein [Dactylonectria macrodidyma]